MDLAAKSPVEIDKELARLWGEQEQALQRLVSWQRDLEAHQAGRRRYGYQFEEQAEKGIVDNKAKLAAARDEAAPFEAEFARRGGWNRYFLVTNNNGHVHRGMDCNTCFDTTQYAWLIDLADCDEDKMIEEYGEKACTVCFPTAPANPRFHAPGRIDAEAKAARDAEKAAKQAVKDAKAITAPDGSPLKAGGDTFRTKISAQRGLSAAVSNYAYYGPSHPSDFLTEVKVLAEALEAAGIDPKPIIERAEKKAIKEIGGYEGRGYKLPALQ